MKNLMYEDIDYISAKVEIYYSTPEEDRVNINPKFDITGVGRIFDITNFVGFNFKG